MPLRTRIWLLMADLLPGCMHGPSEEEAARSSEGAEESEGSDRAAPRPDARGVDRERMVRRQIEARGIENPAVLRAMREIPRHWFVPASQERRAYIDSPLPIGYGQTISQPYIVAHMTEALELSPSSRVLEVGTGSGYQAAILSAITPHVATIEIVPELAQRARETFERHGYGSIQCRSGDGYGGWPELAPFDAIIVTAAPDHLPAALTEQLAPGGHLVIPVGDKNRTQELLRYTKRSDGSLVAEHMAPVRFVPMTGRADDHLEPVIK